MFSVYIPSIPLYTPNGGISAHNDPKKKKVSFRGPLSGSWEPIGSRKPSRDYREQKRFSEALRLKPPLGKTEKLLG